MVVPWSASSPAGDQTLVSAKLSRSARRPRRVASPDRPIQAANLATWSTTPCRCRTERSSMPMEFVGKYGKCNPCCSSAGALPSGGGRSATSKTGEIPGPIGQPCRGGCDMAGSPFNRCWSGDDWRHFLRTGISSMTPPSAPCFDKRGRRVFRAPAPAGSLAPSPSRDRRRRYAPQLFLFRKTAR